MPASPFYQRIRAQVLQLTQAVPKGRLCTYQSMGRHLDVMPRHVAYILSRLNDHEKVLVPWHRVVTADGRLGARNQHPDGRTQADLLLSEGITVCEGRIPSPFLEVFIEAEHLPSGLPKQTRPDDAPRSTPKRSQPRQR